MNDHQSRPPVTGYPAAPNGYSTSTHTAYPYAAPPPQQNPYYNIQNPYYSPQRATFIRRLVSILVAAFIITGTIVFLVWLIIRPRLPDFRVDSLSLSNFNLSNSLITGNWDVRFTVSNPNKKISLSYDEIQAVIFYGSDSLSETMIPPFGQNTRNVTGMKATFAAVGAYVGRDVVEGINSEKSKTGSVSFNVRMLASVRLKAGGWRTRRRFLRVFCGDLAVGLAGNGNGGTLTGGAKECREGM